MNTLSTADLNGQMGSPMAVSPHNFRASAQPAAPPSCGGESNGSEAESLRLCLELQQQEMAAQMAMQQEQLAFDTEGLDDETKASIELAMRLQDEERARQQEQVAAAERMAQEPEDAESMALAIRLQQEDDEQALRNALGVLPGGGEDGDEPGSPSQYSYEQLMQLGETVGEVSRGAAAQEISANRTMSYAAAKADSSVILGEQCAICRMEFEPDDELRVLRCGHAEHCECIDQWLAVNKSCPICMKEISASPDKSCCPPCPPAAAATVVATPAAGMTTPAAAVGTPATPATPVAPAQAPPSADAAVSLA